MDAMIGESNGRERRMSKNIAADVERHWWSAVLISDASPPDVPHALPTISWAKEQGAWQ
jgi:hypothetical protein